jgi:hypothetical protein
LPLREHPGHPPRTTIVVSDESPRRITGYTKLRNITAGIAAKRNMLATNCMKRGNAVGGSDIVGGMKTAAAGIPIAIGMTTITAS